MKRIIAIAVLMLIAANAHANKGDIWLDLHIGSHHSGEGIWWDDDFNSHEWTEVNPGVGIGYGALDNIELKAGIYKNSHDKTAVYGGVKWHTDYERFISVSVTVGLVSGYEVSQTIDTPITAYILPAISFHPHHRVRIDLGYLPGKTRETPQGTSPASHVMTLGAGYRF